MDYFGPELQSTKITSNDSKTTSELLYAKKELTKIAGYSKNARTFTVEIFFSKKQL